MSNKNVVPEAKDALNKFKMQAASEVGVNLKNGYNGDLTSRKPGSVDGRMVACKKYEVRAAEQDCGGALSEGGVHSGGDDLSCSFPV